ncbi:hypothetical protein A1Q1_03268 [Trichosporon asahii var. asahii CBS 2479]|uniref:Uncharacterized protein n=1 Tax=Trichosporon asahii var. asahii (strain ATCC 90039 / CBS 2479 / JCM 2466 / KCTC 7840 / NBRC 103889/ NCYC 2677 / UAMH 7654) TaxID=1186058 RepID=J6EY87_TRIAS|nr:hypothetical protein A1Q1_03268 [Trichosporon asahii var. asahii CBS 2479]EJT47807.1 hypothetical protein A1Q1_03268 [Trichosporon asahii var. asahii CBS 2479]
MLALLRHDSIIEGVLQYCGIKAQLQLRRINRALCRKINNLLFHHLVLTAMPLRGHECDVKVDGRFPLPLRMRRLNPSAWKLAPRKLVQHNLFRYTRCVTFKGGFPHGCHPTFLRNAFMSVEILRIIPVDGLYLPFVPFGASTVVVWIPEHEQGFEYLLDHPLGEQVPCDMSFYPPLKTTKVVVHAEGTNIHLLEAYPFLAYLPPTTDLVVVAEDLSLRRLAGYRQVGTSSALFGNLSIMLRIIPDLELMVVGLWGLRQISSGSLAGYATDHPTVTRAAISILNGVYDGMVIFPQEAVDMAALFLTRPWFRFKTSEQYRDSVGVERERLECVRDLNDPKVIKEREERLYGSGFPRHEVYEPTMERPALDLFEYLAETPGGLF